MLIIFFSVRPQSNSLWPGIEQEGEKSEETKKLRAEVAEMCEDAIWKFFEKGNGQVVIYDANNGRREIRNAIAEKFDKRGIHVIFLGVFLFQEATRCHS